jgi:DNA-3-methyladenine glycosylase
MRVMRPRSQRDRDLCSGPARLTQAMGITGVHDGIDLVRGRAGYAIIDDGCEAISPIRTGPRIGITRGKDAPWRWYVPESVHVSKR